MNNSLKNNSKGDLLGTVLEAGFFNIIIGGLALIIDIVFEIPPLPINKAHAIYLFVGLIIIYSGLLIWSVVLLISAKRRNEVIRKGPYAIIRHPMYAGIVLFVNPALAILFRSWALLEASLILYFVWKYFVIKEEKELLEIFGNEYKEYSKKVGCIFPKIC